MHMGGAWKSMGGAWKRLSRSSQEKKVSQLAQGLLTSCPISQPNKLSPNQKTAVGIRCVFEVDLWNLLVFNVCAKRRICFNDFLLKRDMNQNSICPTLLNKLVIVWNYYFLFSNLPFITWSVKVLGRYHSCWYRIRIAFFFHFLMTFKAK